MDKTSKVVESLINVGLENGILSQDEIDLIRVIFKEIEKYNNFLSWAIEDNIITTNEKRKLINKRKAILDKAYLTANEDLVVTQEEFDLLKETLEIIYKLEMDEHKFYDRFLREKKLE